MPEQTAGSGGLCGVGSFTAFGDVANYAFAVDHKSDALGDANQRVEHAVLLRHRLAFVAQDRELQAELGSEGVVARGRIDADSDHLRAGLLEFGDISLIRLELLPSARREGANVEGEHHRRFAAKVTEPYETPVLVVQCEFRRRLAHAQRAAAPAACCDRQCQNYARHNRLHFHAHRSLLRRDVELVRAGNYTAATLQRGADS